MRKYLLTAFVLAATLVFATSGLALEKTAFRARDDGRPDDWNAGTTCSVSYWNICTGWLFAWSGWGPQDRIGVCFDNCCAPNAGTVVSSWHYVWTAAPAGYGFTGTIALSDVDSQCCPTNLLESQAFLGVTGWNLNLWNSNVGSSFAIEIILGTGLGSPIAFPTDAPSGPTGPPACGTCYPTTRPNHSFYWGTPSSPLCPGSTFIGDPSDICTAELWADAQLSCVVSVEEASWGSIKNLYR